MGGGEEGQGRGMELFCCPTVVIVTQTHSGNTTHKTVQKRAIFLHVNFSDLTTGVD